MPEKSSEPKAAAADVDLSGLAQAIRAAYGSSIDTASFDKKSRWSVLRSCLWLLAQSDLPAESIDSAGDSGEGFDDLASLAAVLGCETDSLARTTDGVVTTYTIESCGVSFAMLPSIDSPRLYCVDITADNLKPMGLCVGQQFAEVEESLGSVGRQIDSPSEIILDYPQWGLSLGLSGDSESVAADQVDVSALRICRIILYDCSVELTDSGFRTRN